MEGGFSRLHPRWCHLIHFSHCYPPQRHLLRIGSPGVTKRAPGIDFGAIESRFSYWTAGSQRDIAALPRINGTRFHGNGGLHAGLMTGNQRFITFRIEMRCVGIGHLVLEW